MEHVKIENIGNRRFLVYTLAAEESLDPVVLRMMENNAIQGLLAVSFLQKDEKQILKYDISEMTVLADFLKRNTDGMRVLVLFKDLSDILLESREYMIEEKAFLFGMHSVFIGNDGKGRLLCLPVENRNGVLFRQFCARLLNQPDVSVWLSHTAWAQVNAYLESEKFSAGGFSALLDKLELQSAVSSSSLHHAEAPGTVLHHAAGPVVLKKSKLAEQIHRVRQPSAELLSDLLPPKKKLRGYLYRKSSNEKIEVDKPRFCIGKSRNNVDYCIGGNPSISRLHAAVVRQGDLYYIQDMNSLNHTYVNDRMLKEGQNAVLENGTEIRLSDEEFLFLTERE